MTRSEMLMEVGNLLEELESVKGTYGVKADALLLLIEETFPDFLDFYNEE